MSWSVVIPTYNEEECIGELLQSLLAMPTKHLFEIVVVDGGSQDQTVSIAQHFAKVTTLSKGNRGKQLAHGATNSQGNYLWFLHADSIINTTTDLFEEMSQILGNNDNSAGFYPLYFNGGHHSFFNYLAWTSNWRAKHLKLIFGDQGLFTTRQHYEKAGGFETVSLMEDWLLSKQLAKQGNFAVHSQKIGTSARRFNENGKWRTHLKMHRMKIQFLCGVSPERLFRKYQKRR